MSCAVIATPFGSNGLNKFLNILTGIGSDLESEIIVLSPSICKLTLVCFPEHCFWTSNWVQDGLQPLVCKKLVDVILIPSTGDSGILDRDDVYLRKNLQSHHIDVLFLLAAIFSKISSF